MTMAMAALKKRTSSQGNKRSCLKRLPPPRRPRDETAGDQREPHLARRDGRGPFTERLDDDPAFLPPDQ